VFKDETRHVYAMRDETGAVRVAFCYATDAHAYLKSPLASKIGSVWAYNLTFVCTAQEAASMSIMEFQSAVHLQSAAQSEARIGQRADGDEN
jgi:hypothetical protein